MISMKKRQFLKFIVIPFIGMVVLLFGLSINLKSNNAYLSDIALINIEALADNELTTEECPGGACYYGDTCKTCCPKSSDPRCEQTQCGCWSN
jgi:hypothetical protein